MYEAFFVECGIIASHVAPASDAEECVKVEFLIGKRNNVSEFRIET